MIKNDSKYFYTARLMNKALLSLLEKKDIEFISVTEIAKKAGVNRSTFYLHYENVYELLEETLENLNDEFMQSFSVKAPLKIERKEDAYLINDAFIVPYLNFVKDNKRLFKLAHQKPQVFNAKTKYKNMYDTVFYPAVSCFLQSENERIYYLEFFTGGVIAIVNKWLERDCVTEIDEIVKIIKKCINYKV